MALIGQLKTMICRHTGRVIIGTTVLLCVILLSSLITPHLSPHDPNLLDPMNRLSSPDRSNLLGSDVLGRDVMTRLLVGGKLSLTVGFTVAVLTTIIGYLVGLIAGFSRLDNMIMRVMDGLMAFPALLLALGLVAVFGASASNVVIALVIVYSPSMARLSRGAILKAKSEDFVEAALSLGSTMPRIIWKHIVPNSLTPVIVQATFVFAYAIQVEATLSFLGVGVPPELPTWGNVLRDGRNVFINAPWIAVSAGGIIFVVVLSINMLGDALRDHLDPRMRGLL